MRKKGFGFLVGAGIGAAITALFTTEKGKEYQVKISKLCEDIVNKAKDVDIDDVKENIEKKVNEIKTELQDLDKEKVKDIASKKAKDIQEKSNSRLIGLKINKLNEKILFKFIRLNSKYKELALYAKEKGTPVLQEMTENLRDEAIKVTKKVLKKLESSKKESKKEEK